MEQSYRHLINIIHRKYFHPFTQYELKGPPLYFVADKGEVVMAIVNRNALARGFSGMIGGVLIFRRVGDQTVVQAAPVPSGSNSPAQKQQRGRFKEAAQYAQMQMANAVVKEAYALLLKGNPRRTAYHVALTDFLNPPKIRAINCTGYSGRTGDRISVCATDDFRVTEVRVQIVTADGIQLESGNATLQPNRLEWVYVATVSNPAMSGSSIIVHALDLPGNETVKEQRF